MNLSRYFFYISCFLLPTSCSLFAQQNKSRNIAQVPLTQHVDPFIGTSFHGHVFMGANRPFGAVQLGPVNMSQGWDWCSGYHYSDSTIVGFSHTHLSGTGIGDLGDILMMPATGAVRLRKGKAGDPQSGYYSRFSHKDETAHPGFYAVTLQPSGIKAELTASERVGFHQYTFPMADNPHIVIDLREGIGWDLATQTHLQQVNDTIISGYRFSKGWAPDQRIFFTAVFSRPIKLFAVYEDTIKQPGKSYAGKFAKGIVQFDLHNGEQVMVKVGISPVSTENALLNIKTEIPYWNFAAVAAAADAAWNKELNKVQVKTNDKTRLRTFYTALYHTMIAPSLFNDVNGDYMGTDKKVYRSTPFDNYTTFSLWDTYRGAHPLFTILQPKRTGDMIASMLAIYQQQGSLPVWHLMGNETNTMPGHSGVQVVADAYLKGLKGFDTALAYAAVKATAMGNERGLQFIKENGYIPADSMVESVAMGQEYAISDWSIAQMAKRLDRKDDYDYFSKRGKAYQYYFDKGTGFVRGRLNEQEWRTPFSPFLSQHRKDDFAEGNAWQYTWLAPQDVEGLMELMGGEQKFITKLDSLFFVHGDMGAEASNDITGLIGQYAHGNEPSHHITYLYAYAGQPWKTAEKVRYILDSMYTDKPDGLIGNEDVGQMSAWYILSALGFYPANPANGQYVFGSPYFDDAMLQLESGKTFRVQVNNNSKANKYIQKTTWNGKPYTKSFITYKDIMNGGVLQIEMGVAPSKTWGTRKEDRPFSETR